jgi:hypothetical protein
MASGAVGSMSVSQPWSGSVNQSASVLPAASTCDATGFQRHVVPPSLARYSLARPPPSENVLNQMWRRSSTNSESA